MANDLNLFVLWANGRHKETEIINDINRHFEILQSFEITWTPKLFTRNLSRFYGKKLPSAVKKKRLCGTGSFLVICVNDTQPRIHNGKNLNIIAAKARYRQIIGSNCIHAGDLQPEAEENLLFLPGSSRHNARLSFIRTYAAHRAGWMRSNLNSFSANCPIFVSPATPTNLKY